MKKVARITVAYLEITVTAAVPLQRLTVDRNQGRRCNTSLNVLSIINEPTSAAISIAYGLEMTRESATSSSSVPERGNNSQFLPLCLLSSTLSVLLLEAEVVAANEGDSIVRR